MPRHAASGDVSCKRWQREGREGSQAQRAEQVGTSPGGRALDQARPAAFLAPACDVAAPSTTLRLLTKQRLETQKHNASVLWLAVLPLTLWTRRRWRCGEQGAPSWQALRGLSDVCGSRWVGTTLLDAGNKLPAAHAAEKRPSLLQVSGHCARCTSPPSPAPRTAPLPTPAASISIAKRCCQPTGGTHSPAIGNGWQWRRHV